MSFDSFDIQEEALASSNPTISRLMEMASELIENEKQIEAIEEALKGLNGRNNYLKITGLPDLMAECGLTALRVKSGHAIELKQFVNGSLPKDPPARKKAIDWLSENGGSDLIKSTVNVEFSKTEHNAFKSLASELRERDFPVLESETVHAQTLAAFAREKLLNGDEIPLELLGLFSGRTAKVNSPKSGRS